VLDRQQHLGGEQAMANYETAEQAQWREKLRRESIDKGFDLRSEVSADARYIVKHLWTIFVLLPVALGILFEILNRLAH
jgi:hypothetical protein